MRKLVNLRELRERAALSQEELGNRAGISKNAVGQLERGEFNPRPLTVRRLAQALDVKPEELWSPKAPTPLSYEELVAKEEGREREAYPERRYLIPLLDSHTSILRQLIDSHGPFLANLSRDLPPRTSFAIYQRVAEFLYTCGVIERALDEKGIMEAADSVWVRVDEGEQVPAELKVRVQAFQNALDQLFKGIEVEALDWARSQQARPDVVEFHNQEKRESEKRRASARAQADAGGEVIYMDEIIAEREQQRSKREASIRRTRAQGAS